MSFIYTFLYTLPWHAAPVLRVGEPPGPPRARSGLPRFAWTPRRRSVDSARYELTNSTTRCGRTAGGVQPTTPHHNPPPHTKGCPTVTHRQLSTVAHRCSTVYFPPTNRHPRSHGRIVDLGLRPANCGTTVPLTRPPEVISGGLTSSQPLRQKLILFAWNWPVPRD